MRSLLSSLFPARSKRSELFVQGGLKMLPVLLRFKGRRQPTFGRRLAERDMRAVIIIRDTGLQSCIRFYQGKISAATFNTEEADVRLIFNDTATVMQLVDQSGEYLTILNANFISLLGCGTLFTCY